MSRTLKWVLAILAVLVVLAVLAGAVFVWQNRGFLTASARPYAAQPNPQANPGNPSLPNGPRGFGNNGRNPMFGYGFRGPMMGRGFGPMMRFGPFGLGFFFFGGLLRWIVPLILIVLVAIIFYQLGKRSVTVRREPLPATPPPADHNPPQG